MYISAPIGVKFCMMVHRLIGPNTVFPFGGGTHMGTTKYQVSRLNFDHLTANTYFENGKLQRHNVN